MAREVTNCQARPFNGAASRKQQFGLSVNCLCVPVNGAISGIIGTSCFNQRCPRLSWTGILAVPSRFRCLPSVEGRTPCPQDARFQLRE